MGFDMPLMRDLAVGEGVGVWVWERGGVGIAWFGRLYGTDVLSFC
jgi:hypothetical protein